MSDHSSGSDNSSFADRDTGQDDGGGINRDIRFINAVRKPTYFFTLWRTDGEDVMVYRNEDTGWGWPPYFKLDSSNLQAEAADAVSTQEAPRWYVIRHYGWRSPFLSIYPNAVSLKPIDDPNQRLIPYFNIAVILIRLLILGKSAQRTTRSVLRWAQLARCGTPVP